jgi:predicted ArsR family transcriptional regulator
MFMQHFMNHTAQPIQHTRKAVLDTLRSLGHATVNQLAEAIGVKAITIRHHLVALQAEGLIAVEEKRQTVGRPAHIYSLNSEAETLFPQRYYHLVERLLDQVKAQLPPETVAQLIDSLANAFADDIRRELESLPSDQRMSRLIELLAREGFMAQWQRTDDGLALVEYHCPYFAVSQRHPEICQIDERLIRVALDAKVAKESCLLAGDSACKFILSTPEDRALSR